MKLVEQHLMEHLSLEELAFLSHKSLSSFKRDFERSYGISPGKFIRERKLELASKELLQGKSPSELYLEYGYESLSNFIQAFKKKYGYTPSAFRKSSIADRAFYSTL
jgi:AraC-like DNA-binding protein